MKISYGLKRPTEGNFSHKHTATSPAHHTTNVQSVATRSSTNPLKY